MFTALKRGQFPVRWVPDLGYGYGYPIFNFYNPLAYYIGASGMFFGLDALSATKLMMAVAVIASGLTMYIFTRSVLPVWPSVIAGILYLYAPYHGVQIYVRGAVAEYWAYALLPLVFWAFWNKRTFIGGIALASLVLSHNLTSFMSIPYLFVLAFCRYFTSGTTTRFKTLIGYLLSFTFAIGLSAFFWLPALVEAQKTRVAEMVFREFDPAVDHLVTPIQLWSSVWGYGGSSAGTDDGLSLQLGKIHLIGAIAAMAIWLFARPPVSERSDSRQSYLFSFFGFILSVFMLLPTSSFIWNSIPALQYIQFPWRFLSFASFFSSFLTAWVLWVITKRLRSPIAFYSLLIISSVTLLAYSIKFFQPQFKYPTTAEELTARKRIVWEVSKRSDEYLPKGFQRPRTQNEALLDGNQYNQELIDEIKKPTAIRRVGNMISLLSLLILLTYGVHRRTRAH